MQPSHDVFPKPHPISVRTPKHVSLTNNSYEPDMSFPLSIYAFAAITKQYRE